MGKFVYILLCALLALSITSPITASKYSKSSRGGHKYPSSGGLSGGGHSYPSGSHTYPSSGGHSGSHTYPSSGGLSGGGSGSRYPSQGNQGYPSQGNHGYPSQGSHGYPSSGGLSGNSPSNPHPNQGYPQSPGYPQNTYNPNNYGYPNQRAPSGNLNTGHTTNIHHHYHYNPPQQIRYTPMHGGPSYNYPVYRGSPPSYVYQYKNSGSKYGTLLAGLALLNLGTVAAGAYALSHRHSNYRPQPGEICKFGLKKDNGDYEETKIDCRLITSFIFQEQEKQNNRPTNTNTVTTTTTNVTVTNNTNPVPNETKPNPIYMRLPDGTFVPVNNTDITNTAGNTISTVTTTNTTVTSAIDVKGEPINVTPGMQCYVMRYSASSQMKKSVPCGLLQTYAQQSLKRNSATQNVPAFVIMTVLAIFVVY